MGCLALDFVFMTYHYNGLVVYNIANQLKLTKQHNSEVTMKTSIVIGIGELGSVFATGLLKMGHLVVPVLRSNKFAEIAIMYPKPDSVWVCVAEKDIHTVLATLPNSWKTRLVLIQNELLPNDWQQHNISNPTILSVWFEKKTGKAPQIVLPSVVYGFLANEVYDTYTKLGLPIRQLSSASELLFELILKNVYIQTTNICGLAIGGNTQQLVENYSELMSEVVEDLILLQEKLTQYTFDHDKIMERFVTACYSDPNHNCVGRNAKARLKRVISLAKQYHLTMPTVSDIAAQVNAETV